MLSTGNFMGLSGMGWLWAAGCTADGAVRHATGYVAYPVHASCLDAPADEQDVFCLPCWGRHVSEQALFLHIGCCACTAPWEHTKVRC